MVTHLQVHTTASLLSKLSSILTYTLLLFQPRPQVAADFVLSVSQSILQQPFKQFSLNFTLYFFIYYPPPYNRFPIYNVLCSRSNKFRQGVLSSRCKCHCSLISDSPVCAVISCRDSSISNMYLTYLVHFIFAFHLLFSPMRCSC